MSSGVTTLVFQCGDCHFVFEVDPNDFKRESVDDFCCPLCRHNKLMVYVDYEENDE